jgi:hypothetical protein
MPAPANQAVVWHTLPETGFLREKYILGSRNAKPPIPAIIPVVHSTWWAGIKAGIYPAPVKLSGRVTAWRVEDIRALIEKISRTGSVTPTAPKKRGRKPQPQKTREEIEAEIEAEIVANLLAGIPDDGIEPEDVQ